MKELHWLPIKSRIEYKICLLTFKALNGLAPPYISDLISKYEPRRPLRSAGRGLLKPMVPKLKRTGGRSFTVAAPGMWNLLPQPLRLATDLESFKKDLKTYLFCKAYMYD